MSELEKEIRKLSNKEIAEHSSRFFKTGKGEYGEGDKFLGVRVPKLRALAKKHIDTNLTELKKPLKSPYHEVRLCGFILLVNQYLKSKDSKLKETLYKTYIGHFKYLNNWDIVDVTCPKIIGPHLQDTARGELYEWAKSKNLWKRRVSIISTFHYIRNNDLEDAYKLSRIHLADQHDLMHKAVGWVLRECGKKDLSRLEKFIMTHYKKMPRIMLRYAIEKFPETKRKKILNLK
jgi:3-methyladenine DNA glycosylase AlkD